MITKKKKNKYIKNKATRSKRGGKPVLNDARKLKKLYDTNKKLYNEQIGKTGPVILVYILKLIYKDPDLSIMKKDIIEQLFKLYFYNKNLFNSQISKLDYINLAYLLQSIPDSNPLYKNFRENVNSILLTSNFVPQLPDTFSTTMFGPVAGVSLDTESIPLSASAKPFLPSVPQPTRVPSESDYIVETPTVALTTKSPEQIDSRDDEVSITLSQHALERMQERNITENDIQYLIKNADKYRKGKNDIGSVRIYSGLIPGDSDLYKIITSDSDSPYIITVIRDKDLYTQTAYENMEANDISSDLVEYIVWETAEYKGEERDAQGGRLKFIYTTKGKNITVFTNKTKTKIIGVFVKSMHSPQSQPNGTHQIDYHSEGCALQRTDVSHDKGVDCGRCSISYAGIGTSVARSILQNKCVKGDGALNSMMNKWLKDYAFKDQYGKSPIIYYIHPDFVNSIKRFAGRNNIYGYAAEIICDKLLGHYEQVVSFWNCHKTYGHYYNIGKLNSDIIWYINPQDNTNAGEKRLIDQINTSCGSKSWVTQIGFILQPWQASLLIDDDGDPLVINEETYWKKGYNHTGGKTRKKFKKRNKKSKKRV